MSDSSTSRFVAIRAGTLNRFYTRTAIGDLLLGQMNGINPKRVLDLGAGEGSLSVAVAARFPSAQFVTVDIDPACIQHLRTRIASVGADRHQHYTHDVFDPDLPSVLSHEPSFDLAVCNPPFFRPKWTRDAAKILASADLADACPSTADVTAEILFLSQNLRFVSDGGTIAFIAPDGLITGWRAMNFRKTLLSKHRLDCVLQLPSHSFHDTEARCFVLFMTKLGQPNDAVKLLRYDALLGISEPLLISAEAGQQRLDYDYHVKNTNIEGPLMTLSRVGASVQRGSLSTVDAKNVTYKVFHTTDFTDNTDGYIELTSDWSKCSGKKFIVAEPGDILIARVDRKLHKKIAMVVSGYAPITDCVYRVRAPAPVRNHIFNALRSPEGSAGLLAVSKGVSARLLGKADLLNLPLEINL